VICPMRRRDSSACYEAALWPAEYFSSWKMRVKGSGIRRSQRSVGTFSGAGQPTSDMNGLAEPCNHALQADDHLPRFAPSVARR
jgi:hypothetical protein